MMGPICRPNPSNALLRGKAHARLGASSREAEEREFQGHLPCQIQDLVEPEVGCDAHPARTAVVVERVDDKEALVVGARREDGERWLHVDSLKRVDRLAQARVSTSGCFPGPREDLEARAPREQGPDDAP
jgi:hypothetical protein